MAERKACRRKPCPNCPFRRTAPLGYWAASEYKMLADTKRSEQSLGAVTFGCHQDRHRPPAEQEYCIGWLLSQRAANVPNWQLRIAMIRIPAVAKQVAECEPDGPVYTDVEEILADNLRAIINA